jgi:hypothetical protein
LRSQYQSYTQVLEHAIASGVRVFERHDEHAVLAELIRGMYRVGTPFVIGDVIEHITDHTDLDPLGWGRRYKAPSRNNLNNIL